MSDGPVDGNSASDGPGIALAKAREAADITQREVADALNLPVATIDAIEQDDRDHLPADVFTRGYIRAYARLLQLDPGPLVAAFVGGVDPQDLASPFADAAGKQRNTNLGSTWGLSVRLPPGVTPARLLAGAGVLLVVIILAIWLFAGDEPAENDDNKTAQSANASEYVGDTRNAAPQMTSGRTATEPVRNPFTPEQPAPVEAQTSSAVDIEVAQSSESDRQPDVSQPDSEPAAIVEAEVQSVTPPGVRRLTPAGDERLSIEFTEECWVEIKDPEGNLLYGNLGRPGTQLAFVGAAPFRVLLGYAPGAMLRYNAEPVALGPHTRNNVASLVLGQ